MAQQYTVSNKANITIWWKDGGWNSGDLKPGNVRTVDSNHDADVTIFGKNQQGVDTEWGRVWIPLDTTLEVYGKKNWLLK
jgi:hypothetical protein